MEITKIEQIKVHEAAKVRIKEMGNIVEIMYSNSYTSKCSIRKLTKDTYLDLTTGEVKTCNHIENRGQNITSVQKTLTRLRDLINTNVTDVRYCKMVTLTYQENMRDTVRLNNDFKMFNRRLRKEIGHYEYIVSREPQGRGAWHCHVIMIFDKIAPFIPNDVIWKAWSPKGFKKRVDYTKTTKIDNVDNVGAYLTAYMTDMELCDVLGDKSILERSDGLPIKDIEVDEDGKKVEKRYVKGARLHLYPPKFNIYSNSKGIERPDVTYDTEKNAQKKVRGATQTYSRAIQLSDAENNFNKIIDYRYYNLKRKDGQ